MEFSRGRRTHARTRFSLFSFCRTLRPQTGEYRYRLLRYKVERVGYFTLIQY